MLGHENRNSFCLRYHIAALVRSLMYTPFCIMPVQRRRFSHCGLMQHWPSVDVTWRSLQRCSYTISAIGFQRRAQFQHGHIQKKVTFSSAERLITGSLLVFQRKFVAFSIIQPGDAGFLLLLLPACAVRFTSLGFQR